ncbi:16S rRNA (guanine(966)-N(2))-methyltransferase RsmD [Kribbia dieselivorans]|uniref:16S rRNA (guanine(966)-N(2))-methyltransferase RsmD n=1 Tax=Kribbia dieselivorans TaxID=331526 RepID=UPI00083962B9|nr:16S rRNA (guanine(966)-N(2))-methyltransferase RsmD [Kribbia dieselivorans]
MTRIIGGVAGGRQIAAPPGNRTRPTSDKVREALFSSLESRGLVDGAVVLDLYAGSGALGLEALSRGASHVTCVDDHAGAVATIRRNADTLGLPGLDVRRGAVATVLGRGAPARPADLVLADPPYDIPETDLTTTLRLVVDQGWLAPDAFLVVERSSRNPEPTWPAAVEPDGRKVYGETTIWFAWGPGADDAPARVEP